jgi:hypothetical protein
LREREGMHEKQGAAESKYIFEFHGDFLIKLINKISRLQFCLFPDCTRFHPANIR